MRRFVLRRDVDVSGISGEGVVVWGLLFPDGVCAYRWNSPTKTTCLANSIGDIEAIHGHNGATKVVWLDPAEDVEDWERLIPDLGETAESAPPSSGPQRNLVTSGGG